MEHLMRALLGLVVALAASTGSASAASTDINVDARNPAILAQTIERLDYAYPTVTKRPNWDSSREFRMAIGRGIYYAAIFNYPSQSNVRGSRVRAVVDAHRRGGDYGVWATFDRDLLIQTTYTRFIYAKALRAALKSSVCPARAVFSGLKFFATPGLTGYGLLVGTGKGLLTCWYRGQLPR